MKVYKALENSLLFKNMPSMKVEQILSLLQGRTRIYEKNEMIICEGNQVQEAGILVDGELCKVQYYQDGTEQLVQKLQTSFLVGMEVAVSQKKTSPYTIYATQRSEIFWFPIKVIEEEGFLKNEDRIELYQRIVAFLANEDIRKYRKIEIISGKSVRERICKYLKIQSLRYGSLEFEIDFNREEMANYLGLNRSVLSHELKKMEREGLLTVRKNHFSLHEDLNL